MEEWQTTLEKFISDKIDNKFEYIKKTIDYDTGSKIINAAYLLPHRIVLSILKPYETLDDNLVSFSIYYVRELLISDFCECDRLCEYINKVNEKLK